MNPEIVPLSPEKQQQLDDTIEIIQVILNCSGHFPEVFLPTRVITEDWMLLPIVQHFAQPSMEEIWQSVTYRDNYIHFVRKVQVNPVQKVLKTASFIIIGVVILWWFISH